MELKSWNRKELYTVAAIFLLRTRNFNFSLVKVSWTDKGLQFGCGY